jgi:hypothetical protein
MEKTVRLLCMLSVFCALATQLCPEGREKRVLGFVCSVVLLSALFRSVRQPDWDSLALEAALLHQREEAFLQDAGDLGRELQRTVIEEKCEAYIRNRAGQIQIDLEEAAVTAQWSLEGIWVPHSAMLFGDVGERERAQLAALLEAELGIPRSRQEWRTDGA